MFQPSNELRDAAKLLASNKLGIPEYCFFPRWRTDGSVMWLESSSRSIIVTLNFRKSSTGHYVGCEITFSDKCSCPGYFEHRPWIMEEFDREGNRV